MVVPISCWQQINRVVMSKRHHTYWRGSSRRSGISIAMERSGRKGRCVRRTAVISPHERNIITPPPASLPKQRALSLHLSAGYVTDYFGHSNSGSPPGGKSPTRASVSSKQPPPQPLPTLVFLWISYREGGWGGGGLYRTEQSVYKRSSQRLQS